MIEMVFTRCGGKREFGSDRKLPYGTLQNLSTVTSLKAFIIGNMLIQHFFFTQNDLHNDILKLGVLYLELYLYHNTVVTIIHGCWHQNHKDKQISIKYLFDVIGTINFIILQNVATYLEQTCGHPQATRPHKTKITMEKFIFGQNETSFCYTMLMEKI